MNSLDSLSQVVMAGVPDGGERSSFDESAKQAIEQIFGDRYRSGSPFAKRVVLMPGDDKVSFAGLVHQDSPPSGVYGGMSLIWFPFPADNGQAAGSLLTLVCGTRGLSPDENIIGRPGHLRHLRAFQRYLREEQKISSWVKLNPSDLSTPVPKSVQKDLSRFESVLKRYGNHIYFCVEVPADFEKARTVVSSLFDIYAWERGWTPLKAYENEIDAFKNKLRSYLFPMVNHKNIVSLLKQRRFVILQGPPGTGKTRLSSEILKRDFDGNGFTVQFHPAVSYESFVAGISPRVDGNALNFEIKGGYLLEAIEKCNAKKPVLLCIDEINRADLARVLGEAIYLFEPREIAESNPRTVDLPHAINGKKSISIPKELYILDTMNSADRSIAIMDLAVRRRFAFVDMWPDINVVEKESLPLAVEAFSRLQDIFTQYASADAFPLLPGHSYFLANSEEEFAARMRYELLPLLNEYTLEGRLSSCETELRAYMDWLDGEI